MVFAVIMTVGMAILIGVDLKMTHDEAVRRGTDNRKYGSDYYDDTED